ncbi:hypothetical protein NKDENANG_03380 [Candidatus Entotheonellaceae bacterium PAL068K]
MRTIQPNVAAVLGMLLEEIEAEIELVKRVVEHALKSGDYEKVKTVLKRVEQITAFRNSIDRLHQEWQTLSAREEDAEGAEIHTERRNLSRVQHGLSTPQKAYYRPILEVLEALGGSARVSEVLDHVFRQMKDILRDVDYEPVASNPKTPRWRKNAQWVRYSMVEEGLLRSNSPRGIWEISDAGIRFLQSTN